MTNDEAELAAREWAGQAGGKLLPQLTANELAGIVNEAIRRAIIDGPGVEPVASNSKAILEAVGRAYCWPANENKQVDPFLAAAIVAEIASINPAAPVQAVPDGWQLVPKEPTTELLQQMHLTYWRGTGRAEDLSSYWDECSKPLWERTYKAMLAAAPQPPKEIGE